MSNYGHYNHQYDGNHIPFPDESFTIFGISHYKENCRNIGYDSIIAMKEDPDNQFDSSAVAIYFNDNIIGYVPKRDEKIKKMCMDHINDKLVIINISTKIYGIRVIPETFYNPDPTLERQVMFADTS